MNGAPKYLSLNLVSLALLAIFPSCGGGGLGGDGSARGSVAGKVRFDASAPTSTSPNGGQDREPNDHLFEVQDLGELDGSRDLIGSLGVAGDRVDFFRMSMKHAGHVKAVVRSTGRTTLSTYLVRGGKGRPEPLTRQSGTMTVEIAVAAEDHLIVGVASAQSTSFHLSLELASGFAAMTLPAMTGSAIAAASETLLPSYLEVRPGEVVLRLAGETANGLYHAGIAGFEPVRSGGGYHLMRATQAVATSDDRGGREALAGLVFGLRRRLQPADSVEPNYVYRATLEPNDALYRSGQGSWHHRLCNMPKAWDITTGNGVVVAVLDTGVVSGHEDLKANVLATDGYDFIDNDADANDPLRTGASYHGSHVAGIIAAATNNSTGIAGVCWNAKILPLRVLGVNGGSAFSISQGILYAAGLTNQSGRVPQNKARVINMSFGGPVVSVVIQDACKKAQDAGVILVAAAGNEFQQGNPTYYPAAYPGVIGVGSVGPTQNRASYSNTGSYVDIAAPGGDQSAAVSDGVLSTVVVEQNSQFFSGYSYMQGTSMAAPFASGVIALLLAKKPMLSAAEVLAVLGRTAVDLGNPGKDEEYGFGLIDAAAALEDKSGGSNGVIRASTQSVVFTEGVAEQAVRIDAIRGGSLPLSLTPDQNATWLTATLTGAMTPAELKLSVDRRGLGLGTHRAIVKVSSGSTSLAIKVSLEIKPGMTVPTQATVQLFDADMQFVGQTTSDTVGAFILRGLGSGKYTLRIGVDSNANGSFADPGDWRSTDRKFVILPGENLQIPAIPVGRVK